MNPGLLLLLGGFGPQFGSSADLDRCKPLAELSIVACVVSPAPSAGQLTDQRRKERSFREKLTDLRFNFYLISPTGALEIAEDLVAMSTIYLGPVLTLTVENNTTPDAHTTKVRVDPELTSTISTRERAHRLWKEERTWFVHSSRVHDAAEWGVSDLTKEFVGDWRVAHRLHFAKPTAKQ